MVNLRNVGVESKINPLSRTVVHVSLRVLDVSGNAQEIGTASGVIRTRMGLNYLITALHVLTGGERGGKPGLKHPPNQILIEGFYSKWERNLYEGANDPYSDRPLYWKNPNSPGVDVGILPLRSGPKSNCSLHETFFNPTNNEASSLYVMQECYIVGFPYGLVDRTDPNLPLPIWKTGHIASEPFTDFQGQPKVLIDGLTRPGQSGAPVFVGSINYRGKFEVTRFVGIYAGREKAISRSTPDGEYWDLGYVFKPIVVEEIFTANLTS